MSDGFYKLVNPNIKCSVKTNIKGETQEWEAKASYISSEETFWSQGRGVTMELALADALESLGVEMKTFFKKNTLDLLSGVD